ncbi:MAG: class I SAM-dependent methyltransferase [Fibrobacter sp.]|nr:class I SAM-dependent methyltransferase [Fibrobacter sp.]
MRKTVLKLPFTPQQFSITIKNQKFNFLCPGDPDSVLDSITDDQYEKDQFLPYWVDHWPAAQILFPFILDASIAAHISACELGCGLGVISTALASKNIKTVSIDISPQACIFAFENIYRNSGIPRVLSTDWRYIGLLQTFDLIVASDVLYEERWIEPILTCIKQLLNPGGKAWIADPCRRHWEAFKAASRAFGFSAHVIHKGIANEGKTTVEILELKAQD